MDTTKVVIKSNVMISSPDSIHKESKQNNSKEIIMENNSKSFSEYFCNCNTLDKLIWPIIILLIIIIFKSRIKKILDNISERIKKGHGFKFGAGGIEMTQEMNSQEVYSKAKEEFTNSNQSDSENKTTKKESWITLEEFVPKYIGIERKLFEILLQNLYPENRILSNRRIQGYEYDLIIETKKNLDYIAEVKYFPTTFSRNVLPMIGVQLDLISQVYKNTYQKDVQPILFIILKQETKFNGELSEVPNIVNLRFKNKEHISVAIIYEDEIEKLSRLRILQILDKHL